MLDFPDVNIPLAEAVLEKALPLTFNSFGCRVIQHMVERSNDEKIAALLLMYAGHEKAISKDRNGNHIGESASA